VLVSFEQLPDRLEGRETWKHRVITRIEIANNWAGLVGSDFRMIKLWFNIKEITLLLSDWSLLSKEE